MLREACHVTVTGHTDIHVGAPALQLHPLGL